MHAYPRFAAMIVTSTLVMFGLMYLNTYQLDHVFFSETRTYMALVMGAAMAVIMLAYMMGMYKKPSREHRHHRRQPGRVRHSPVARPEPNNGRGRVVHARDDPSPFHRHSDERTCAHHGSTSTETGRSDHREPTPRDRGDESVDSRHREQVTPMRASTGHAPAGDVSRATGHIPLVPFSKLACLDRRPSITKKDRYIWLWR